MATKLPTNFGYVNGVCVTYRIDPAATSGLTDFRGVVLTGPVGPASNPTNKPTVNYPQAASDFALGIVISGCDEPLSGDFPSAAENHVTVVHSDTFILEVGVGETINVGDKVALDSDGKAVALTTGVIDTGWIAKDESLGTSTLAQPDYIRVILRLG